jgi:hypothetical protein
MSGLGKTVFHRPRETESGTINFTILLKTQCEVCRMSRQDNSEQQKDEASQRVRKGVRDSSKAASEADDASTVHESRENKKEPAEWWRSPEVWTAVGTIVLAVFGIPSFVFLYLQLRESHEALKVDQRAWIKVETAGPKSLHAATGFYDTDLTIAVGQPLTVPMRISNIGKTPAENVEVALFVGIIDAASEPPLERVDENVTHASITTGNIFPWDGIQHDIPRRSSGDSPPEPVTGEELDALRSGKAYIAIYGIATYEDVFGTHRWTRFCGWEPLAKGNFQAKQCVEYNTVDNN